MISNVKYKPTGRNLAEGETFVIKECKGRRIGFIGIVEYEWMATLATVEEKDIEYEDFVSCTRRLSSLLRDTHHVDAVIALTHMRVPNDEKLARECGDCVDLICGGHDHHYDCKPIEPHGCYVLKSGTDFRDATTLTMKWGEDGKVKVENLERIVVDAQEENEEAQGIVRQFTKVLGAEMEKDVGYTNVALDGRFQMVRTSETNLGNFVTDVMRRGTSADIAVLNSGTLRSDSIMPAGDLKMKDLVSILPMVDELCVIEMTGSQVLQALENGVSQYPRLEGRFPQISGLSFTFDAASPSGSRVVPDSVSFITAAHESVPFDLERSYRVATKAYLAKGKDGYDVFKDCKVLVDGEEAPVLPALVRNTFTELSVLNGFKNSGVHKSVMKSANTWRRKTFHATPKKTETEGEGEEQINKKEEGEKAEAVTPSKEPTTPVAFSTPKVELMSYGINPVIEGRIKCLNPAEIN
jgi:5'-nucleotidase